MASLLRSTCISCRDGNGVAFHDNRRFRWGWFGEEIVLQFQMEPGLEDMQGLPSDIVGGFRSLAALMGVLGAVSFAIFQTNCGLRMTGFIGFVV